jgi:BioD-like phosphotransacetylase family protein
VLPYDKSLSYPIMATVMEAVRGRIIFNEENLDNRVEDYISGSLIDTEELHTFRNLLLVVSHKRLSEALLKVHTIAKSIGITDSPLSGIIITGDGRHEKPVEHSPIFDMYVEEHKVPVLTTSLDTLGAVVKISRIEVKINTRTPWKAHRAIELIREHVDLEAILNHE